MILVTLGTQDKSFERLLIEIERLIDQKIIREEVIVQSGYTSYSSKKMKIFDYLPKDEFEEVIGKCSCLITHGGVGTIFDGLSRGKKIIAVPRLAKYKEHVNDHQIQVIEALGKENYLLPCLDVSDIEKNLKKIKKFQPKVYQGNHNQMTSVIKKYIDEEPDSCFNSSIFQYFTFGIFFIAFQYLFSQLGVFQNLPKFEIFLIYWLISYLFTIVLYRVSYRIQLHFSKKVLFFSIFCIFTHSLIFLILSSTCSFLLSTMIGSLVALLFGYIIFMLVLGGRNLFHD